MAMAILARRRAGGLLLRPAELGRFAAAWRGFAAEAEESDVVVIGGGPGGYVAAIKAAQLGFKTTCIEKRGTLGGTCLNVGCIPSKALLHSSHLYHEAKHAFANHGIKFSHLEIDLPAMMAQKDKAVSALTRGIEGLFKKNKVTYIKGHGKFISPSEISVDTLDGANTIIHGKHIIIATGSEVKSLPGVAIDEQKILSSTGALSLQSVPKKLVVIGAGYIGLEMGSVWSRLGSEVTVVEFGASIVPAMDAEIRNQFQRVLEKQKMKFLLETKVVSIDASGDGVKLALEASNGGRQNPIQADAVLISAGRIPFTENLDLEKIGVETDEIGRIPVDRRFRTKTPGVYAVGDAIPGPMLAHKAEEDGVACVELIAGEEGAGHGDYNLVPGVVYTHPEVAYVGQTEEQVRAAGVEYRVGKFPLMANSRAKAIEDYDGVVKMIAEKETDRILGVHIMAPNAGEIIHEAAMAMQYGASSEDVARTCHAHPTISEAVKEAAMATYVLSPSFGSHIRQALANDVRRQRSERFLLTLWEKLAINEGEQLAKMKDTNPVILLKSVIGKFYNGFALSTTSSSSLEINPDIVEAKEIKEWFSDNKLSLISSSNDAYLITTLVQIDSYEHSLNEIKYHDIKVSIKGFKEGALWYDACNICKSKVFSNDGNVDCSKCSKKNVDHTLRYLIRLDVEDSSGCAILTIFDVEATEFIGIPVIELSQMKIDPRHRYGHNLDLYYDVWFESESTQPFFYWLDVGDGKEVNLEKCSRSTLQQQCIKYLGPREREA